MQWSSQTDFASEPNFNFKAEQCSRMWTEKGLEKMVY